MKITFWGAAQAVTGSMHAISVNDETHLLDCGLLQRRPRRPSRSTVTSRSGPARFVPSYSRTLISITAPTCRKGMSLTDQNPSVPPLYTRADAERAVGHFDSGRLHEEKTIGTVYPARRQLVPLE